MRTVYLKTGKEMLPGLISVADVLAGGTVMPKEISPEQSLGLVSLVATLEDSDLKACGAGRMVRKTSERQARWVIDAAVSGWASYSAECLPERTGLFLGLGTVDCEDDEQPIMFNGDLSEYAAKMLTEAKPLAGLTLLNSTAASHIAQLLNITGVNAVFSPFADAGAQALCEAWFCINEEKIDQALVAAGGQKITPWYFLAYRDMISQWSLPGAFPTESAASIVAGHTADDADGCLLAVKRTFLSSVCQELPALDELLTELAGQHISLPKRAIVTGRFSLPAQQAQRLNDYLPGLQFNCIDNQLGFTGAVGSVHAVNLALSMFKRDLSAHETVLVIAQGHHGQLCYLVIGGCHA